MRESSSPVRTKGVDVSTPSAVLSTQHETLKPGSRKRVFTFQKRWLHSLPIVERALFETDTDGRVFKGDRAASEGPEGDASDASKPKDVIVCMLCDDPASKRELTKVWNRLNCRRGRIENHLMSKHPEFMRLLKHKREAEGDVAVQLFLQNLREGRCNARTEINTGLYSQLSLPTAPRSSPVSSSMLGDETALPKRTVSDYLNVRELREEAEGMHKRAKGAGSPAKGAPLYSTGGETVPRSIATLSHSVKATAIGKSLTSSASYQDAMNPPHWETIFFNKLIVVTGGDNKAIAFIATQLWLLGANVLLTFSNVAALDEFNTKHLGRFPDPCEREETPRGVMLPVLGSFRTQESIVEWCNSIATKYQRVDYFINYAGSEMIEAPSSACGAKEGLKNCITSSVTLIETLCESMSSTCFSARAMSENTWSNASTGIIVNVAPGVNGATVEPLVKLLAAKLQPRKVQVNCVLLPPQYARAEDNEVPDYTVTLSHTILFLLSPLSRLLSGSVLRVQLGEMSSSST